MIFALLAAVAANGVNEPPRRGTFVETSAGVFTVFGGSPAVSNAQPWLGLAVGRELGERAAVFLSLGVGANSAACFQLLSDGSCAGPDSFGLAFLELGASYGLAVAPRTLFSLKLVGGVTDLSPTPLRTGTGSLVGFHGGAGFALDYDTRLAHFAVGADVLARYTRASDSGHTVAFVSLAVMPRIRYVF